MVQTTAIHRPFHGQQLPLHAASQSVINVETVAFAPDLQTLYPQNLMSLEADTELLGSSEGEDITLAVLEGQGSLILNEEVIPLEPGRLIFIPAQMPHALKAYTRLVFLLNRCESDPGLQATAWVITL
ncbi:MAG: cupin domain-containing protein [Leptolyngbyaceae bacterium]|nr:cupin domain-containing protein [Leptolyngbyaceae bacterium]